MCLTQNLCRQDEGSFELKGLVPVILSQRKLVWHFPLYREDSAVVESARGGCRRALYGSLNITVKTWIVVETL